MLRFVCILVLIEAIITNVLLEAGLIISFVGNVLLAITLIQIRETLPAISLRYSAYTNRRSYFRTSVIEAPNATLGPLLRIRMMSRSDEMICRSCGDPSLLKLIGTKSVKSHIRY